VPGVRFWIEIGPFMKELIIGNSTFHGVEMLRRIIFDTTPNLVSLSLVNNIYEANNSEDDDGATLMSQLEPYNPVHKNLQVLYLVIDSQSDNRVEHKLPITWMELLLHFGNIQVGLWQLNFFSS